MMKRILLLFLLSPVWIQMQAQKINGQWKGYFDSKGDIGLAGDKNTEYILELDIKGTNISGYSYTYFDNRRWYMICSISGTYYPSSKSMRVNETSKVKGLMPPGWSDCMQTHVLTYEKIGDKEQLSGKWLTAPGQTGNCGNGMTVLTRRTLSKDLAGFNKPAAKPVNSKTSPFSAPTNPPKKTVASNKKNSTTNPANSLAKKDAVKPAPAIEPITVAPEIVTNTPEKTAPVIKKKNDPIKIADNPNFEKRNTEVVKTIEVTNRQFKIDLYDNGEVDGDSISLFFNGKLILSHKKLSAKPITLNLNLDDERDLNELTMYADNLGTIPPNTALMIVTDGDSRYEVRISSDLKKSGTIRFKHKDVGP